MAVVISINKLLIGIKLSLVYLVMGSSCIFVIEIFENYFTNFRKRMQEKNNLSVNYAVVLHFVFKRKISNLKQIVGYCKYGGKILINN